mmetsp:Transcript_6226/g.15461  ORF Transcript_6226/g.15461 Transcript_6226/m.15461 type:complete len:205 (-) Transcript_6226:859-1473(-)
MMVLEELNKELVPLLGAVVEAFEFLSRVGNVHVGNGRPGKVQHDDPSLVVDFLSDRIRDPRGCQQLGGDALRQRCSCSCSCTCWGVLVRLVVRRLTLGLLLGRKKAANLPLFARGTAATAASPLLLVATPTPTAASFAPLSSPPHKDTGSGVSLLDGRAAPVLVVSKAFHHPPKLEFGIVQVHFLELVLLQTEHVQVVLGAQIG